MSPHSGIASGGTSVNSGGRNLGNCTMAAAGLLHLRCSCANPPWPFVLPFSPALSSEEIKLDVKTEGETWVRRDLKRIRTNPWKQPWLVQVAFAVGSAAKEAAESCRLVGLGLIPSPALPRAGFWDVRMAGWHGATEHASPGWLSIPYAEHTNPSFYSLR